VGVAGGFAIDVAGTIFISDSSAGMIRKVTLPQYTVSTVAGNGSAGYANGAGVGALFSSPRGIVIAADGSMYVADLGNHAIRKIDGVAAPAPPALPAPVVSVSVVDGVSYTAGLAVGTLAFLGGGGSPGIAVTQFKAFIQISRCEFDPIASLNFLTSPTNIKFGTPVGQHYRGGVVGTTALFTGIALLLFVGGSAGVWYRERKAALDGGLRAFLGKVVLFVHFPSVLVVPLMILVEGLSVVSTAVIVHATSAGDYILGVFG
jgi:hypothetical protein